MPLSAAGIYAMGASDRAKPKPKAGTKKTKTAHQAAHQAEPPRAGLGAGSSRAPAGSAAPRASAPPRGFFVAAAPARKGARGAAMIAEAREGIPAPPTDVGEPADAGAPVAAPPGGPPPVAHTAREWTAAEAAERLAGLDEIPRADWERIPYGVRVRYYLKGVAGAPERFQPGGYISANPLDVAPADGAPPKRYFRFQTGFDHASGRRVQWVVPYDDVARVFVRLNAGTLFALRAITKIARAVNDNYARIEAVVARIEARLARLERGSA